jgi:hypothetical protein
MIIERQTTYDCAPTLGDDAVLQFTKDGWLSFPAVVAPEVNERCVDFLSTLAAQNAEANGGVNPGHFGPSDVDPVALLGQEWFVDGVLLCPAVIGAVRSLLGACVGLPVLLHNHRVTPFTTTAARSLARSCSTCRCSTVRHARSRAQTLRHRAH